MADCSIFWQSYADTIVIIYCNLCCANCSICTTIHLRANSVRVRRTKCDDRWHRMADCKVLLHYHKEWYCRSTCNRHSRRFNIVSSMVTGYWLTCQNPATLRLAIGMFVRDVLSWENSWTNITVSSRTKYHPVTNRWGLIVRIAQETSSGAKDVIDIWHHLFVFDLRISCADHDDWHRVSHMMMWNHLEFGRLAHGQISRKLQGGR